MPDTKRIKLAVNWLISQGVVHSQQAIGELCGVSNKSYLSQLVNGRVFNREFINKFSKIDDRLNEDWLLTGEGEMLKVKEHESNARIIGGTFSVGQRDNEVIMVNYVPVTAMATFIESVGSAEETDFDKFPIVPRGTEMKETDKLCIFEVEGDSMYPTIPSGALILAKEIPERSWHYAEGVVVAVYDEFVVVKRIRRNSLGIDSLLVLRSDNEKYGDMTVQLSDIRVLYKAKRIISSEIR